MLRSLINLLGKKIKQNKLYLLLGIATFLAIIFTFDKYILSNYIRGGSVTIAEAAVWSVATWYVFALLTIPLLKFVRQFPLRKKTAAARILLYFFASIIFSIAHTTTTYIIWYKRVGFKVVLSEGFILQLLSHYAFNLIIFSIVIGLYYLIEYYRIYHERELRTAELKALLSQSRLQVLKMQIQPHFLFNTLNGIAALMYEDVDKAHTMLSRLSDLLRIALESTERQEITLQKEITFLKSYLDIQELRFQGRLQINVDTPKETLNALVPNMILQPFVENIFTHGFEPLRNKCKIEISSRIKDNSLILQISDNGPGFPETENIDESSGIGISNTRKRLHQLFGEDFTIEFTNNSNAGMKVTMAIPYRDENELPMDIDP